MNLSTLFFDSLSRTDSNLAVNGKKSIDANFFFQDLIKVFEDENNSSNELSNFTLNDLSEIFSSNEKVIKLSGDEFNLISNLFDSLTNEKNNFEVETNKYKIEDAEIAKEHFVVNQENLISLISSFFDAKDIKPLDDIKNKLDNKNQIILSFKSDFNKISVSIKPIQISYNSNIKETEDLVIASKILTDSFYLNEKIKRNISAEENNFDKDILNNKIKTDNRLIISNQDNLKSESQIKVEIPEVVTNNSIEEDLTKPQPINKLFGISNNSSLVEKNQLTFFDDNKSLNENDKYFKIEIVKIETPSANAKNIPNEIIIEQTNTKSQNEQFSSYKINPDISQKFYGTKDKISFEKVNNNENETKLNFDSLNEIISDLSEEEKSVFKNFQKSNELKSITFTKVETDFATERIYNDISKDVINNEINSKIEKQLNENLNADKKVTVQVNDEKTKVDRPAQLLKFETNQNFKQKIETETLKEFKNDLGSIDITSNQKENYNITESENADEFNKVDISKLNATTNSHSNNEEISIDANKDEIISDVKSKIKNVDEKVLDFKLSSQQTKSKDEIFTNDKNENEIVDFISKPKAEQTEKIFAKVSSAINDKNVESKSRENDIKKAYPVEGKEYVQYNKKISEEFKDVINAKPANENMENKIISSQQTKSKDEIFINDKNENEIFDFISKPKADQTEKIFAKVSSAINVKNVKLVSNENDTNKTNIIEENEIVQLNKNENIESKETIENSINKKASIKNEHETDLILSKTLVNDKVNYENTKTEIDNKKQTLQNEQEKTGKLNTEEKINATNEKTGNENKNHFQSNSEHNKNELNELFVTNNHEFENAKQNIETKPFYESIKHLKQEDIIPEFTKFIQQGEKQSISFQLTPENLGKVNLIVDLVDDIITTKIEVENEQIKQFIQSNIEQLKTNLQTNGIQINNINISLADYSQRQNQKVYTEKRKSNSRIEREEPVKDTNSTAFKKNLGYNTLEFLA